MQKMPNKNYLIHIISAILLVAVPAILPYFIYKTVMFAGDYRVLPRFVYANQSIIT